MKKKPSDPKPAAAKKPVTKKPIKFVQTDPQPAQPAPAADPTPAPTAHAWDLAEAGAASVTPEYLTGQPTPETVSSEQSPATKPEPTLAQPARSTKIMDLTLKHKPNARATDRLVIFDYTDRKGSVQFLRTAFGETIPDTITMSGEFTEATAPREPETKEQRKARLAALPKPTLAEKIEKLRKKLAAQEAKAAKQAAAAAQPEGEPVPA